MPDQTTFTNTKTGLGLGIKVAVFTGLIGAGAITAALFVKNLSSDESAGGGGGGAQPALKMMDLTNVEVVQVDGTLPTSPAAADSYYVRFVSAGGSVTFGRMELTSSGLLWEDGRTYDPAQPIRVELSQYYGTQYPAVRFRLSFVRSGSVNANSDSTSTVDVCLPDQTLSRIIQPYWLNVEGAGYFDVRLTQRYFAPCEPVPA